MLSDDIHFLEHWPVALTETRRKTCLEWCEEWDPQELRHRRPLHRFLPSSLKQIFDILAHIHGKIQLKPIRIRTRSRKRNYSWYKTYITLIRLFLGLKDWHANITYVTYTKNRNKFRETKSKFNLIPYLRFQTGDFLAPGLPGFFLSLTRISWRKTAIWKETW